MAENASFDSDGFSQVIAKELELTQQQVSRLSDKDVDISSMEEICCLKRKDLDELFPELTIKQKIRLEMLKKQFQKEPPPPVPPSAGLPSTPKVRVHQ